MKVFPTRLFAFDGTDATIDRRTVSGGTSLAGEEDLVATDGGGRVTVDFTDPFLDVPRVAAAYRALAAMLDGGATPIIVPLGDARHQMMGDTATPPYRYPAWEESDFADATPHATMSAAALRATTLTIATAKLRGAIYPGAWLSIRHANLSHRAYQVADVPVQSDSSATLVIRPPLREAVPDGTAVEFYDPKCVMRVDGEMRTPTTAGYMEAPGVRFVEHFAESYA